MNKRRSVWSKNRTHKYTKVAVRMDDDIREVV